MTENRVHCLKKVTSTLLHGARPFRVQLDLPGLLVTSTRQGTFLLLHVFAHFLPSLDCQESSYASFRALRKCHFISAPVLAKRNRTGPHALMAFCPQLCEGSQVTPLQLYIQTALFSTLSSWGQVQPCSFITKHSAVSIHICSNPAAPTSSTPISQGRRHTEGGGHRELWLCVPSMTQHLPTPQHFQCLHI